MKAKLKKVNRKEILGAYQIRYRSRKEQGLSVENWEEVLNEISKSNSDYMYMSRMKLHNGDVVVLFIDRVEEKILGYLDFK